MTSRSFPWPSKTLGGPQFWTDEWIHGGWRIQRHAWSGQYRLLDEANCRHTTGTQAECQTAAHRLRDQGDLPEISGRVVILLHGIARTRRCMSRLESFLRDQGGYTTFNMEYASTRFPLKHHAAALTRVVENLAPEVTEINFVTHSMGGLVVRHFLADASDAEGGKTPDPRIRRLVMIGPPNHGSQMARLLDRSPAFQWIWGSSGRQMARWQEVQSCLATPQCEFGIVAGGTGKDRGRNPLLQGDDDLIVTIEETRLAGAHDFIMLPFRHSQFHSQQVFGAVLRFLDQGYFISESQRQPISDTLADRQS